MILMTLPIVMSATEWTQYTPSPTATNLEQVVTFDNGNAFAYTGAVTSCFLYNSSGWINANCPDDALDLGQFTTPRQNTIGYMSKLSTGNIIIYEYTSPTPLNFSIIKYDADTNEYTSVYNYTGDGTFRPFNYHNCIDYLEKCFASFTIDGVSVSHSQIWEVYPNFQLYATNTSTLQTPYLIPSNRYVLSTGGTTMYYWGGSDWLSMGGVYADGTYAQHHYKSTGERFLMSKQYGYFFNVTSGTWNIPTARNSSQFKDSEIIGDYVYITGTTNNFDNSIIKIPFNSQDVGTSTLITPSKDIYSIDYSSVTGEAWAVGETGIIYYYNGSSGVGGGTYSVDFSISPNPVIEGTSTIFYITPVSSSGYVSSLQLNITDLDDNWIYTAESVGIASGSTTQLYLQGTSWSDFYAGQNYKVIVKAVSSAGEIATHTDYMNVTSTIRTNVTNYNASSFTITIPAQMYGLAHFDEKNTYSAFSNTSGVYMVRFESTNPANISMTIRNTRIDTDTSTNQINDLDTIQGNDKLFLASDTGMIIYDNLSLKNLNSLTFRSRTGLDGSDDVYDVKAYNHELSAICQDDWDNILYNDDFFWFNSSNTTFYWNKGVDPCKSVELDGTTAFVHRGGTLDIISFDSPTATLYSSIDVGSTSTYSTHDLLSLSGDNLFAITNLYYAQRFDITNVSNVGIKENCFVVGYDHEITSIEALNNYTLILGTKYMSGIGGIQYYVCDYSNNDTYKVNYYGYTGYEAKPIANGVGLTSYDCKKMNSYGKYGCVEGDTFNVMYFGKTIINVTLNQAPVIVEINLSDDTPCVNQDILGEIVAYDNEDDELVYDYSCEGDYNVMRNEYRTGEMTPCTYTSTGSKTITAFVDDSIEGDGRPVKKIKTIIVEDCVANNTLRILVYECDSSGLYIDETKPISSASVKTDYDNSILYTDSSGKVYFNNIPSGTYNYTINKSGYYAKTLGASGGFETCLRLRGTAGGTGITIYTQNSTGSMVSGSLVSITNTLEGTNAYGFTNLDGYVVLQGVYGDKLLITATNEEKGYPDTYNYYVDLQYGESKTITITFGTNVLPEGQFSVTDRGCKDLIDGILLCGNLSIYNNGSECHVDNDCISKSCIRVKINSTASESDGTCSNFNWSVCDRDGMGRGQGCFMIKTTYGGISSFVDGVIIKYLFLVIAVVFLLFFFVIARRKK